MKTLSKVIVAGMAVICLGLSANATPNKAVTDTTKKAKMSKMNSKMDSKMDSKMSSDKMDSKMSDKKMPSKMKKDSGKMSKM
jgi:hypothetical protein